MMDRNQYNNLSVLVCGTGEYTSGFVEYEGTTVNPASDKQKGVVGLTLFDLKSRKKIKNISFCGTRGYKFPALRRHFIDAIENYYSGIDTTFDSFPGDEELNNPFAYKEAIDSLPCNSGVAVYTPDEVHFEICKYALDKGMHILVAKPAVLTIEEHNVLLHKASSKGLIFMVDYHKRWDPVYIDARERVSMLGEFCYWYSYMSQPITQLKTFQKWTSKSLDVSYYLNSHHIDIHCWFMQGKAVPVDVVAFASTGVVASMEGYDKTIEDSITLVCRWENNVSKNIGTAVYTANWIAPENAEVHSQQRFTCLCKEGEVRVDQAHRGYEFTGNFKYSTPNPNFMSYARDTKGYFAGASGYGYQAISSWVEMCLKANSPAYDEQSSPGNSLEDMYAQYPTLKNTLYVTAILEAGRQSLNLGGKRIPI